MSNNQALLAIIKNEGSQTSIEVSALFVLMKNGMID
jgi:hypothetical protein